VFGYFFIKGRAVKAFTDIDHLNLAGSGEYGAQANPPFYGQIRLKDKNKTDYKLLKPTQNGKNFSFTTETVNGVSYEFNGVLSRTDFSRDPQPSAGETVLTGTLKKKSGGKLAAQSKVSFRWELGD